MSEKAVPFIKRACKRILSDNRQVVARKRLRGSLFYRERSCKIAADILALTRMNAGNDWTEQDKGRNEVIAELRKISIDIRTGADGRVEAIRRLCVLDGLVPIT